MAGLGCKGRSFLLLASGSCDGICREECDGGPDCCVADGGGCGEGFAKDGYSHEELE